MTMNPHVVIYAVSPSMEAVCNAASLTDYHPVSVSTVQELSSQLYRDPDAIGVMWSIGAISAAETIRRMREGGVENPVIALLDDAKPFYVGHSDIAMVLNAGGDDVQSVKIDARELRARIDAVARRRRPQPAVGPTIRDCAFDVENGLIRSPRGDVHVTLMEAAVLDCLIHRPGSLLTRQAIGMAMYRDIDGRDLKIIDVFVCKLRKKLAAATGGFEFIENVYGQGYRWHADGRAPFGRAVA